MDSLKPCCVNEEEKRVICATTLVVNLLLSDQLWRQYLRLS